MCKIGVFLTKNDKKMSFNQNCQKVGRSKNAILGFDDFSKSDFFPPETCPDFSLFAVLAGFHLPPDLATGKWPSLEKPHFLTFLTIFGPQFLSFFVIFCHFLWFFDVFCHFLTCLQHFWHLIFHHFTLPWLIFTFFSCFLSFFVTFCHFLSFSSFSHFCKIVDFWWFFVSRFLSFFIHFFILHFLFITFYLSCTLLFSYSHFLLTHFFTPHFFTPLLFITLCIFIMCSFELIIF